MCRGVSHTPFTLAKKHVRRYCFFGRYRFVFAHIRAYAIRPYTCSVDFWDWLGCWLVSYSLTSGRMRYAPTPVRLIFGYLWGCVMIPFSPTSGRMRYAPTPVRLIFGIGWVAGWFRFRSFEGVCDTPLHMFDCFLGLVGLGVGFVFAHIRAYAIRPYTCSFIIVDEYG